VPFNAFVTGVKTASITQTSHSLSSKLLSYKTKWFVLLLMSHKPLVIPNFIKIKNSAATDFWQNLLIWCGIPVYENYFCMKSKRKIPKKVSRYYSST
jgi:hypothetical protein